MNNIVLLKPLMTEKSMKHPNTYVFEVVPASTKQDIRTVVEALYNVTVGSVRTVVKKGKVKTVGRKRKLKQQPLVKKAYITLTKGEIPNIKVQ